MYLKINEFGFTIFSKKLVQRYKKRVRCSNNNLYAENIFLKSVYLYMLQNRMWCYTSNSIKKKKNNFWFLIETKLVNHC